MIVITFTSTVSKLRGFQESFKRHCCRDPIWQKVDGTFDEFAMGIPRSWETTTPTSGIFKCRYATRFGLGGTWSTRLCTIVLLAQTDWILNSAPQMQSLQSCYTEVCSADDRNVAWRKGLAQTLGAVSASRDSTWSENLVASKFKMLGLNLF